MANIAIFRINYKSDFILTLNSDAGWMTPFCIKFWTGAPSQAYFVGYDGTTYTHCAPVDGEPTKLLVQFDDHHLPIGDLKFQIGYHFTVSDFPTSVEDEVINQASVIIEQDGEPAQVMLDFNGETAPEIEFSLPAYANEAQRIANEEQRIAAEQQRIANEDARIQAEETRQYNEQQRIQHEEERVSEFARLKSESEAATTAANAAATLANEKAQLAADKAALADAAATLANEKAQLAADKAALAAAAAILANDKAALAQQKAAYAQEQGDYAKAQGDYAKAQGDTAQADHERAEDDHTTAAADHTTAAADHTTAASDHSRAEADHTTAASDHSRAESDHTTASSDHTRAESDHTTAASDHTRAESDHTIAAADHTTAQADHTRAESDHAAVEVYVDSLGVFDLSKHNAVGGVLATYADLSAALTALNALDSKYKYGGMSFKFVQSSDNKYVRYNYLLEDATTNSKFTNVTNWNEVEENVVAYSPRYAYVITDKDGKIAIAVEKDANVIFGAGVPKQVVDYIQEKIEELNLEEIVTFLGELIEGDTLAMLLDGKVDKVEGKSLINEDYADNVSYVDDPNYAEVKLDADDKMIKATLHDGTIRHYTRNDFKSICIGDNVETEESRDSGRYIIAEVDSAERVHHAVEKNGVHRFPVGINSPTIDALNTKIEEATPTDYGDVKERLNEVVPATRSFFGEEIIISANTIREHSTEPCLVLSIITDTHERPYPVGDSSNASSVRQTEDTFANVAAVGRKCVVDGVMHLGDWLFAGYSYPTQDVVNDYLERYRRLVAKCNDKVYFLFGNHDGIGAANPSIGSAYAEMFKMNEDYVKREGANPYYYFDNEKIKVRCICFDDNIYPALYGWNKTQIQWFADVLSELEDGWQIIIMSHIQPYDEGGLTNKDDVVGIANAFNNHTAYTCTAYSDISVDFTGNESTKTVAWISGHAHYDMVITDNSVFEEYDLCCPIILIGCSLLYQAPSVPEGAVSYSRTDKTITQDLWDTMVYRPDLGKIYMVRFGAGVDREINV